MTTNAERRVNLEKRIASATKEGKTSVVAALTDALNGIPKETTPEAHRPIATPSARATTSTPASIAPTQTIASPHTEEVVEVTGLQRAINANIAAQGKPIPQRPREKRELHGLELAQAAAIRDAQQKK